MFITFEGIEGSGKTTQINHILKFFKSKGHPCISTREPGDTRIGKKIRSILLDPENNDLVPLAELFLYAADRAQHLSERIMPSLADGKVVICDRFFDATTAYQGYARGLGLSTIDAIHKLVLKDLKPDITILFDLSPEIGLKRAWQQIDSGSRSGVETRFEKEKITFHEKVRDGYLRLAAEEPERFVVVDASQSEKEVQCHIETILSERIDFS